MSGDVKDLINPNKLDFNFDFCCFFLKKNDSCIWLSWESHNGSNSILIENAEQTPNSLKTEAILFLIWKRADFWQNPETIQLFSVYKKFVKNNVKAIKMSKKWFYRSKRNVFGTFFEIFQFLEVFGICEKKIPQFWKILFFSKEF